MNTKALLNRYDLMPKKSLGQNFLNDPGALDKIVSIADIAKSDTVLEIGPGTGLLTAKLARAAHEVIAVELDRRFEPLLNDQFGATPNVRFVYDDILRVNPSELVDGRDYLVVANVPYYITSAILKHILERPERPRRIVMTVQLEVAERICAGAGDMSLLAVSVQYYGKPRLAGKINAASFWPRPDVDSAVLRIDPFDAPPVGVPDDKLFFNIVRAGFSQKRKQLKNSLSAGLHLNAEKVAAMGETSGVDLKRRAETLTLEEWAALTRAYIAVS